MFLAIAAALPAVVIKRVRALFDDDGSEGPKNSKISISVAYRVEVWVSKKSVRASTSNV